MASLGFQLFDEVRPEFFRLLTGPSAPTFVNLLEALEHALETAPEGLPLDEAVVLAKELLDEQPLLAVEEDDNNESGGANGQRDLPRSLIRRLLAAGWLEKPRRNDFRELVFLDPNAKIMLGALKRLARPGDAVFTDPLEMVAKALTSPDGFRDNPWGVLQACLASVGKGVEDLEQIGKAVTRLTRRQVQTESLGENLVRVFEEFSRKFAQTCYRELIRTRLHTRLPELLARLEELAQDESIVLRMREELLRRQPELSSMEVAARMVRQALDRLRDQLSAIPPLADRIDQHTAEFARRSLARFRYLQEIGTRRREALQDYFELVKQAAHGRRLVDVDDVFQFPPLQIVYARIFAGVDSLFPPRKQRTTVPPQPIDDAASPAETDEAFAEIQRNLRDSLSVHRANRFIDALPGVRGARIPLDELRLRTMDDLEDLIAVLLNAGSRDARYRVVVPRVDGDQHIPVFIELLGYKIETFELHKTAEPKPASVHGR